jgi:hypothetical protein
MKSDKGKSVVVPVPYHNVMTLYGSVYVKTPRIQTSALVGDEW